jgi:hypothetical protein
VLSLINPTRFCTQPQLVLDARGEERLLLVMKASFELCDEGLQPTDAEVVLADQYRGDPANSSLAAASEVVLFKPQPDLLLSGHAYPTERGGTAALVSFRVGAWSKDALVFGDRVWTRGVSGLRPGAPQPFERIPLVYERAFGGADLTRTPPLGCPENPVGVGMVDCRAGSPVPNLEHPRHLLEAAGDRPPPRAFGPIPPHWQPRLSLHGTFDAEWQRTRMPLPPLDADPRAAQVAPPDQLYPRALAGGEPVELRGVSRDGPLRFRVPRMRVRVTVHDGRHARELPTALDTLHVDADALRLDLTWRAHVSVHEGIDRLAWVKIDAEEAPHG